MPLAKLPFPEFDEKGKLICQICGKSFLTLSPKHLEKHNITFDDYRKRYPNAPITSKEFNARSKFGKNKELFADQQEKNPEPIEPEIEELDIEAILQKEIEKNPMKAMKNRIKDFLRVHYSNVRSDYLIRQFGVDQKLKFEFITDFCDPILKVVIQFPDTFWHNNDLLLDMNKKLKLESYGWKYIEIPTNDPSNDLIDEHLLNS
jgi:very-short-patch-repair endonuclease